MTHDPMPPYKPKYPCGVCDKAVKWKTPAIACDNCDVWFHKNCAHISTPIFNYLSCDPEATWQCPTCGIPSFTSSFFESTLIDDSSLSNVDLDSNASGVTSPVGLLSACSPGGGHSSVMLKAGVTKKML